MENGIHQNLFFCVHRMNIRLRGILTMTTLSCIVYIILVQLVRHHFQSVNAQQATQIVIDGPGL